MKINPFFYIFFTFIWGLSIFLIYFTGTQLKAIYTWVSYYDDFLNTVSQSRFNTYDTIRTFFPGVVRQSDTAHWNSPYKNERCVLAHTAIMAEVDCTCLRCGCQDRQTFHMNQVKGASFWVVSDNRRVYMPDTLSMARFVTDGEYWLNEPILPEIPTALVDLEMIQAELAAHEEIRGYRVHETTVKEGDSICLYILLDRHSNIIDKGKYKLVMLGGFADIRDRLVVLREKHQTRFNDQLVWVILSAVLFLACTAFWGWDKLRAKSSQ